jgi:MFS superfamily sulfate permease-like transporter
VSARKSSERQYRDFEFNLRELARSMGDLGTLFPLAIGYIAVNGLNPAGLFIMLGLTNIALGLVYRLPMPLQPKKVIAVTAVAQEWAPSLIYASGFGLGLLRLIVALTGLLRKLVEITPTFIVRGIQLALGVTLAWQAVRWMLPAPLLGFGRSPSSCFCARTAQIPLSITNAVIAPAALIRDYFPEKAVTERKLMLNIGVMNVAASFFGGMPMCHGAGGLAGQIYFGARTGGTPIMEGLIEVAVGLLLSTSITSLMAAFPMPLIAGMLLLVGIELARPVVKLRGYQLGLAVATAAVSVVSNMAIGFAAGLAAAYLLRALRRRRVLSCACGTDRERTEGDPARSSDA